MAVYKVEKDELVKVGENLEDMVRSDWADWENFEDIFLGEQLKFRLYDDATGVYRLYRREEAKRPDGELPDVKYIFDVNVDGSNFDYILVEDSLPQFLAVMRMLEPLAARQVRLEAEFEKEQNRRS
ncbi:hypothetical protein SAMN05216601_10874 [Ectopseudomonas composti]|uniref:Uncharacterized protein n=1 Tax=Ectopseudomonas composti TaxID=658457 RepID=A0A1I5P4Y1_9GAMM|nr:hypothetical protein [Pseudomonas composti]SFP29095.1 hypothetical protein SAMN05216601_10874 [Pseudomonas composti]